VPFSRKFLVQGALRNNRVGVAVLLDVVKGLDCVDHEVRFYLSNMN
jgi:putative aminopeptidase FrvX